MLDRVLHELRRVRRGKPVVVCPRCGRAIRLNDAAMVVHGDPYHYDCATGRRKSSGRRV